MFRNDADIQKLAETLTQSTLDDIADDAVAQEDDERKYETFAAGYDLGKSAGTKDVWEALILGKDKVGYFYFFIGTKEEVVDKLKRAVPKADEELTEAMEMEGT